MYAEERQQAIAERVHQRGRASVTALAEEFDVTSETVRRDLAYLERAGCLRRVHGGAVPLDSVRMTELGVVERSSSHPDEKVRIGTAAARFVPSDGGSLLIDAGTTTLQAALRLPRDRNTIVFTNSLPVATSVADHPTATLHFLGGRIRGITQAAVGIASISALQGYRIDVAFIGTNGLTERHGLSTPDPDEGAMKSAMIAAANRVVLLADSSKIGNEDLTGFAAVDQVDVLITDAGIDPGFSARLSALGVEVVIA
ncbi:DeoR/GlpR family DNA-binding transcription regulator [Williamsia sp. CHRR-6]|uniref:DeoR/GlpR family DNA-binding transcription regulator n=1 Tax=Williamsia sp. CHRR-6 TaxID=2835871 RepID=UPI001BDAAD21|nr:DeoR/GlpR family DNA-binding transcription regulator [Williamsia sp. CHRR-6]MBT0567911.1 DeoR/GlpR transcriptional regulator [Williamsia sp. CHRR-6]